jgi:hypothetical protein
VVFTTVSGYCLKFAWMAFLAVLSTSLIRIGSAYALNAEKGTALPGRAGQSIVGENLFATGSPQRGGT